MSVRLKERVRYQTYGPLSGKYAFMGYKDSSYWRLVRGEDGKPLTFKDEDEAKHYGNVKIGAPDFKVVA